MALPVVPVAPALYRKAMPAPETDLPEFYLQPGEWRMVRQPSILKTVLGSCVSITFRAPRLDAAAMCHPMLPTHAARPSAHSNPVTARRYVDFVIREIAHQFDNLGVDRDEVEVKLFGGADVLIVHAQRSNGRHDECGDRATRAQRRRI